jgi:hypothetical protein
LGAFLGASPSSARCNEIMVGSFLWSRDVSWALLEYSPRLGSPQGMIPFQILPRSVRPLARANHTVVDSNGFLQNTLNTWTTHGHADRRARKYPIHNESSSSSSWWSTARKA